MKKLFLTLFYIPCFSFFSAQISDTMKISRKEAETIFLAKNLDLIAQKLEISQAEARTVQAKYWPNPTLSISEVNLWRTYDIEEQPAIVGNWGKNTQISAEIEQVIQTAGKRRKNIELQKIEVEGEKYELQEVLRELKKTLRNTITEILYNQEQQKIYQGQIASIEKLTKSYNNQLNLGNISKAEYVRLKAQEIEFKKKLISLKQEIEDQQVELKALLMLPSQTYLVISDSFVMPEKQLSELEVTQWMEKANENRPDIMISKNKEKHAAKNLEIQNAMKTPDVAVSIGYDRGGNIMKDFIGLGVSMDLPIFDRNKGNIQEAKLEIEKSKLETRKNMLKSENEIVSVFRNYIRTQQVSEEIDESYESTLDGLLVSHEKNFRLRNISMLEYMDFLDTYIGNKMIILDTKKELNQYYENLQYVVGQDL
ncbi:cobalt-zinc-cadmium efflux system outer membrane protein [Chryseobacterium sediminis]|uniref:Cobalt-zinc-cadmium efflux system outer membrane protein n=1 Tax=Chryseobacterium sediminis TaxID=1679494 RepID=A0ABR6Q4G2_9FLAO|nr:TolC family protein [Chryseobacterium sediminis]MBB6332177.1 cobalt-zinc-cadmium efflux system outer membrane protein [Chryseobacterium sediminis]